MTGIGQESVVERARRTLEPVLARDGYELVDVEWVRGAGRFTLRVFIDRPGGVNVDDCQLVSRTIEPILDVEDFIEPAYDLEVSSPGLDRVLAREKDFAAACGAEVALETRRPQDGRRRFRGTLVAFEDGIARLRVDGMEFGIAFEEVARAHTIYRFTRADFAKAR